MSATDALDEKMHPSCVNHPAPDAPEVPGRDPYRRRDNSRSHVLERLPPELRRRLNIAILERVPPGLQAVWMEHGLAKFGISYYSLYRYAIRLRQRADLAEVAGLAAEDDAGLDQVIDKLTARRLYELLLNTDGAELNQQIAALLAAHSRNAKTKLQDRSRADRSRLDWARLEHDREQLQIKSQLLQSAGQGVLKLLDQAQKRHSPATPANPTDPAPKALSQDAGRGES